jgi:hypothetical protein
MKLQAADNHSRLFYFMYSPRVIACTIVLAGCFASRAFAQAIPAGTTVDRPLPPEITILKSDAVSLVFEFRPRFKANAQRSVRGVEYTLVDFAGSVQAWGRPEEDQTDIRVRDVPIALPGPLGNRVTILASDFEELKGVHPMLRPGPALQPDQLFEEENKGPQTAGFRPATPASLIIGAPLGGVTGGIVVLAPVQSDPVSGVIRKYNRLVVEVLFGQPARVSTPLVASGTTLASALLNYTSLQSHAAASRLAAPPVSSVLASGTWYRIAVTEDGVYKLDAAHLAAAGISLSGLDPRTIKIYGNGGKELSEDPTAPRPNDLVENAIRVEGEADGKFDAADLVVFYGKSTRGWSYDPGAKRFSHYIHHYATVNYYWLTFGGGAGKRMADLASVSPGVQVAVDRTVGLVSAEEESINLLSSGKTWLWQTLSVPGAAYTHLATLPGYIAGSAIFYRTALAVSSATTPWFEISESGSSIGTFFLPSSGGYLHATEGTFQTTASPVISNESSRLNVTLRSASSTAQGWIDWVEIQYVRRLWGVGESLHFWSPDTTAVVEYSLQQFSSSPLILDVSTPENVRRLTGVTGSYTFRAGETGGRVSEYYAAGTAAWKDPASIEKMPNQDLRGYAGGGDFIIITTPDLRASADRLKALREQPAYGGLKTVIVDVNQIYNEFSGGLADISGIRDYLKYAFERWTPQPGFVLLLGEASFDYKGIVAKNTSLVPTWESPESFHIIDSYASDDFFVRFNQTTAPSLVLGRINAHSAREAQIVVDKIYRYEQASARDNWKMRVMFVGDDAWQPDGGDTDGTLHSEQTEVLSSPSFTPDELEKKKVYLADYPSVNTAQGRRKPGAAQDIVTGINNGLLMVNFTGHGNSEVWTHERVFENGTTIPQLNNFNRLTFFFLGTCNFSVYDYPKSYTGSELLMNRAEGGAIAVVAANREVYAGANAALNQGSYGFMFTRDAHGRLHVERPATALYLFKMTGGNSDNDQKYGFMGDPTMRLQYPRAYASIDSINGEPVDSVGGQRRVSPIHLRSLSRVTVKGTIRDSVNQRNAGFNGSVLLQVNDVTRVQWIIDFVPGLNWPYVATGGVIYRGDNSVANGQFTSTFIVPKDIAYADSTGRGRLVAYFGDGTSDGVAYTGQIYVGGTDTTAPNDTRGPDITLAVGTRAYRPGDLVGDKPLLYVDLADSSGINTSTTSIGHRIEAWVNNNTQSTDLTPYYASKLDDYRQGSVTFQLPTLPQGRNTLKVRAWDSFNNSASAETDFQVASDDHLAIAEVLNYPNPFRNSTLFTFRQNQTGTVNVTIKVYTLTGRVIRTIEEEAGGSSFVRVPWDGRDDDGDLVANGVYLYKVIARTPDGRFTSEALGKLSIIN